LIVPQPEQEPRRAEHQCGDHHQANRSHAPLPFITDFESPNVAKAGKIDKHLLIILFIVIALAR
jgi:hypothetical protein